MNKAEAFGKLTEYTPRIKFNLNDMADKKILIISPHPDDETLGCGGIISSLVLAGAEVKIVLCTDDCQHEKMEFSSSSIRVNEFKTAIKVLGCEDALYIGARDGSLKENYNEVKDKIHLIIQDMKPDWIFVPYILDVNKDHNVMVHIVANCIEDTAQLNVAMYEVWTPILYPNFYVNITEVFDKKILAAQCHQSQEEMYNIVDRLKGLSVLRASLLMKKKYNQVEAFKYFSAPLFKSIVEALNK